MIEGSGSGPRIKGPKTYGSGSATLVKTYRYRKFGKNLFNTDVFNLNKRMNLGGK
jgi:hypothetical protein